MAVYPVSPQVNTMTRWSASRRGTNLGSPTSPGAVRSYRHGSGGAR